MTEGDEREQDAEDGTGGSEPAAEPGEAPVEDGPGGEPGEATGGSEPAADPDAPAAPDDAPDPDGAAAPDDAADPDGAAAPDDAPEPDASAAPEGEETDREATDVDDSPAEPAVEAAGPPPAGDAVPGADLEPIAISEERELTAEERARAEAEEEERAAREARAAADDEEAEAVAPRAVSVPADAQIQATGKRKSAVARVIVRSGSGSFQVNDRSLEEYFPSTQHQSLARQPLVTTGFEGNVDVRVRVQGGGVSGQAGAVRHGVARALTSLEPELRGDLKRRGMLTRDDRRKERKKAGLKKARKRPQFSKR